MSITHYVVNRSELLKKLKEALSRDSRVLIAVAYGSILRSSVVRDVDLGVVTSPPLTLKDLLILSARLELLVGVPIDIVPICGVSPKLQYKILAYGEPLVVKDPNLFNRLLTAALGKVQDTELKTKYLPSPTPASK